MKNKNFVIIAFMLLTSSLSFAQQTYAPLMK